MRKRNVCWISPVLAGILVLAGGTILSRGDAAPGKDKPVNLDTDPHLMGWWKLDEESGKTAADSSKHKRNGALQGDVTFDQGSAPGRSGKALTLNGREFIEITGYKGVTGTKPRTIAAWVKTKDATGEIMSWGTNDSGSMWTFRIVRSGIWVDPKGGYLYTRERVHDDKWHHVAAVVHEAEDAPTLHDHVKLYKDGELQEIHDIGLLHMYPIETGDEIDVRIGRGIKGLLDDVRLYDRALSEEEIAALFQMKPVPEKR